MLGAHNQKDLVQKDLHVQDPFYGRALWEEDPEEGLTGAADQPGGGMEPLDVSDARGAQGPRDNLPEHIPYAAATALRTLCLQSADLLSENFFLS